jgi:NAD(P)-dependent dehydrogenase (short-subunit alcohol dehydrogenase family)
MTDQTVLITGCSSGIGRASAETFLENDWTVYATARDTADIEGLAEQGCATARLDVTEDEDVERVRGRIESETGRVDCLVNNAGFGQYGPLEDIPVERLHRQFDVNVYGPHRLTRAVVPMMREHETGTIVNVSSFYGRVSTPGGGAYAASKFALEAMSDALRGELDGLGPDVVLVEPGPVSTNFNERTGEEIDELEQTEAYDWLYEYIEEVTIATNAMPFVSEPEDVAVAIHDVACMESPDPRHTVGPVAGVLRYAAFLPDSVRDKLYRAARRVA